jgi:hypothetical protein
MEHYVTLFDSLFLPQGLALHISMERHVTDYNLWILCVDDSAYEVLTKLNLPNVRLLKLSDIETEELKGVKADRTKGEYCWTLTPFAPRFVFEADPTVQRVTYLDADLWFRKKTDPIFEEFDASGKNVLITEHAYAPEYDHKLRQSGRYCVQFMTFTRTEGEKVRKWWEERCIEWCYDRHEDGKFGDQKYLDDWPDRFEKNVHVLQQPELLLAPWNALLFSYSKSLVYHFHGLKLLNGNKLLTHSYYGIPKMTIKKIYTPYITDIGYSLCLLKEKGYNSQSQSKRYLLKVIKTLLCRKQLPLKKIS